MQTKYIARKCRASEDSTEMVSIAYRLDVEDNARLDLTDEEILTLLKEHKPIKGVTSCKKVFKGSFDRSKGQYGKWVGTLIIPDKKGDWYKYDGEIEFYLPCSIYASPDNIKDVIGGGLRSFNGKRYRITEDGKNCYDPDSYEKLRLYDGAKTGFVGTYVTNELVDSVYYGTGHHAYRFTNHRTKKLIRSYTELKGTKLVDIEYVGTGKSATQYVAKRVSVIPNDDVEGLKLLFSGRIFVGDKLEYEGDFLLPTPFFTSDSYIKQGKGKMVTIKSGEIFVERGEWDSNKLITGYGFYEDTTLFTAIKDERIDTDNDFKSTFILEDNYKVIEGTMITTSKIEGTLVQNGKKIGYGLFNTNYTNLYRSKIMLLTEISDTHLKAQIDVVYNFVNVDIKQKDDDVLVQVNDVLLTAPNYQLPSLQNIALNDVESTINDIFKRVETLEVTDSKISLLKDDKWAFPNSVKFATTTAGKRYDEDTKLEYTGEYKINFSEAEIEMLHEYSELKEGIYEIHSDVIPTANLNTNTREITIVEAHLTYQDISTKTTNLPTDTSSALDPYTIFTKALKNLDSLIYRDYQFSNSHIRPTYTQPCICYNNNTNKTHAGWDIEGYLIHEGITYTGNFIINSGGQVIIHNAYINAGARTILISHNNVYIVDNNTKTIRCLTNRTESNLHFTDSKLNTEELPYIFDINDVLAENILTYSDELSGELHLQGLDKKLKAKFCHVKSKNDTGLLHIESLILKDNIVPILYIKDNFAYTITTDEGKLLTSQEFEFYGGNGKVSKIDLNSPNLEETLYYEGGLYGGMCHEAGILYDTSSGRCKKLLNFIDSYINSESVEKVELNTYKGCLDGKIIIHLKGEEAPLVYHRDTTRKMEMRTHIEYREIDDWRASKDGIPYEVKRAEVVQEPTYFYLFDPPTEIHTQPITCESDTELTQLILTQLEQSTPLQPESTTSLHSTTAIQSF